MTELKHPEPLDINFWLTGDTFPNFDRLFCDLVFVIAERTMWRDNNSIQQADPMVDSDAAYEDHYRWAGQHRYTRCKCFTLKADSHMSSQP